MFKAVSRLCIAGTLGLAVVIPTAADAAHQKTAHNAATTVRIAVISSTGQPPVSGTEVYAGTTNGALGSGAITGTNSFAAPNFTGKNTAYNAVGSLKSTLKGSGTLNPDGSASFTGTGKFTGGTGRYKGATGTYSFSGTQAKNSNVTTFKVVGKVKY